MPDEWLGFIILKIATYFGVYSFEVRAMLAVILVSTTCGLIGSLVLGQRMAFFSDAMAHTAFAGVSFALLGIVVFFEVKKATDAEQYEWMVPIAMAFIGATVGVAIAFVREKTNLTTDTVIGVFFASSLGLAALLLPALRGRVKMDPEQIMFGQLIGVDERDLLVLMTLLLITTLIVFWRYNDFVFGSFNPSLGQSRGLNTRFNQYLFIVLLALVVNLSIRAVGILLINAMLLVPAAAAVNISGNLRQLFWITVGGSVTMGIIGYLLSSNVIIPDPVAGNLQMGPGGAIVLTCVGWFVVSLGIRAVRKRFFGIPGTCPGDSCSHDDGDGEYHHHH